MQKLHEIKKKHTWERKYGESKGRDIGSVEAQRKGFQGC